MRRRSVQLLLAASALPVAALVTALTLGQRNTLAHNDRWQAIKLERERGVMGALHFVDGRQALAGGRLDLGAWHGFHEVRLREPVRVRELHFRFELDEGAWLAFLWDDGRHALRISRHALFPSALLEPTPEGAFTRRQPLELPAAVSEALGRGPLTARARFDADASVLWLADVEVARVAAPLRGPQRIGFRGGQESARVDDVVLALASGQELREAFDGRDAALPVFALILALLLGIEVAGSRALARSGRPFPPEFGWVVANGVLTLALAGYLVVDRSVLVQRYEPFVRMPALFERERHWVDTETDQVSADLASRHARAPAPDVLRVLLVGSSQTWGAGARREEEAFPRRLETLLERGSRVGRRVEVLNAGVSGQTGPGLLERYASEWIDYAPEVVLVDLSNNDEDLEAFEASLHGFARLGRERGIETIFIQEPNALDRPPRALPRHEVMERVARAEDIPLVRLHERLAERADTGFLWWDFVHPTSYGHRLIAETLAQEIDWSALRARPPAVR
jgi:lysophospholipase L1-like esterase